MHKRLVGCKFVWPRIADGVMRISPAMFAALFEGLDWRLVRPEERDVRRLRDSCDRVTRKRFAHGAGGGDVLEIEHEDRGAARLKRTLKALLTQTQPALSEHQAALVASEEERRRLEVILGELRREKFRYEIREAVA